MPALPAPARAAIPPRPACPAPSSRGPVTLPAHATREDALTHLLSAPARVPGAPFPALSRLAPRTGEPVNPPAHATGGTP